MYEGTYVHDGMLQRKAVVDFLWSEDQGLFAFPALLVVGLLIMVFSQALRVPAAIFVGFALAYVYAWVWQVTSASRQAPCEQTVKLTDDALETRSFRGEARYRWAAVSKVALTRRFVFFTIGERRLTLPRAALSPDAVAFAVEAARSAGAKVHGRV